MAPLRYLAINVGNASPHHGCREYKLCRAQDVQNIRNYIAAWQPDIIKVYRAEQLTGTAANLQVQGGRNCKSWPVLGAETITRKSPVARAGGMAENAILW